MLTPPPAPKLRGAGVSISKIAITTNGYNTAKGLRTHDLALFLRLVVGN